MRHDPCHVLIVDDEPAVCAIIQDELGQLGHDCTVATEPEQAIRLLDGDGFDLMLADIFMPRLSGLDLLAYAKEHAPRCKVILITGRSCQEYLSRALSLGAYDYIEKPFAAGALAGIVAKAVAGDGDSELSSRAVAAMERCAHVDTAALEVVFALARAVEAKDPYTQRHSEQVAFYATSIATAMGLSKTPVESIRVAALLHDIGKIGVPDHILTKPGTLTDEEFEYIRRHPALGGDILSQIKLFRTEAQIVRHHHERWDGKGYPSGLAGEESPLAARIIQVADCIDAMLMERTYKKGYPVDQMLGELIRCAGSQFDPRIAAMSVAWCQAHREALFLPGKAAPARQEVA